MVDCELQILSSMNLSSLVVLPNFRALIHMINLENKSKRPELSVIAVRDEYMIFSDSYASSNF